MNKNIHSSIRYLLFLIGVMGIVNSFAQTTLDKTISSGGLTRQYRIYIPALYNASSPVPLVFNFHGYTSNNTQQEFYADFRPIADTANFILVHPQSTIISGSTMWNNFGTIGSAPDDITFIANLIDSISASYSINQNRIYATGFSNGGFMSYDLACLLSHRIAAIASVSGSMVSSHLTACNASHPTPVMQIHGDIDATVSYTGSSGIVASTHIDSLIKFWVQYNHCNASPSTSNLPDISTSDNCTVLHDVYNGGWSGTSVELYKIIGGGHSWPGSIFNIPGINTNQDFNASKEIWRFFSQHNLATNIVHQASLSYQIYPNPTQGIININLPENTIIEMKLLNPLGQALFTQMLHQGMNAIDCSKYPTGLYFYQLNVSNNRMSSGKIQIR